MSRAWHLTFGHAYACVDAWKLACAYYLFIYDYCYTMVIEAATLIGSRLICTHVESCVDPCMRACFLSMVLSLLCVCLSRSNAWNVDKWRPGGLTTQGRFTATLAGTSSEMSPRVVVVAVAVAVAVAAVMISSTAL